MNNDNYKMTNDNKYNIIPTLGITYLAKNVVDKMNINALRKKKSEMHESISENQMDHSYGTTGRTHNKIDESIKYARDFIAYINTAMKKKEKININHGGRRTRRNKRAKKSKKSMRRRR